MSDPKTPHDAVVPVLEALKAAGLQVDEYISTYRISVKGIADIVHLHFGRHTKGWIDTGRFYLTLRCHPLRDYTVLSHKKTGEFNAARVVDTAERMLSEIRSHNEEEIRKNNQRKRDDALCRDIEGDSQVKIRYSPCTGRFEAVVGNLTEAQARLVVAALRGGVMGHD